MPRFFTSKIKDRQAGRSGRGGGHKRAVAGVRDAVGNHREWRTGEDKKEEWLFADAGENELSARLYGNHVLLAQAGQISPKCREMNAEYLYHGETGGWSDLQFFFSFLLRVSARFAHPSSNRSLGHGMEPAGDLLLLECPIPANVSSWLPLGLARDFVGRVVRGHCIRTSSCPRCMSNEQAIVVAHLSVFLFQSYIPSPRNVHYSPRGDGTTASSADRPQAVSASAAGAGDEASSPTAPAPALPPSVLRGQQGAGGGGLRPAKSLARGVSFKDKHEEISFSKDEDTATQEDDGAGSGEDQESEQDYEGGGEEKRRSRDEEEDADDGGKGGRPGGKGRKNRSTSVSLMSLKTKVTASSRDVADLLFRRYVRGNLEA